MVGRSPAAEAARLGHAGSTGLLVWFARIGWRISRLEAAALLLAYAACIVVSLA